MSATALPPLREPIDRARVAHVLARCRFRARGVMLETEGMDVLEALGIPIPGRVEIADARDAMRHGENALPSERVVVKAVSPDLLHKTEARAVSVVPNRAAAIALEIEAMEARLRHVSLAGFVVYEHVAHHDALGHEYLLGMRWTRDFGPVVTLGPGGVQAERLAPLLRDGEGLAVCSPHLRRPGAAAEAVAALGAAKLVTSGARGRAPALEAEALVFAVRRLLEFAAAFCPDPLSEFEVNPLVVSGGRLVALDALGVFSGRKPEVAAPRPLDKVARLLEPASIAIAGVSEKLNPGRIILRNVLRSGFDPARVTVIKPGAETIDGCRCVPRLEDLPERVDLVVLSVAAPQAAEMLEDLCANRRAESAILIPGGLEEKTGSAPIVTGMRRALAESRQRLWRGPVVNGGNCLGIRSVPGRYDTLFIPEHKLPIPARPPDPLALVTGSGAFAVSKLSKLSGLNPLYTITIGNQMDLTVADYLEHLSGDHRVRMFGVYLEGFRPLDGARFLEVVERLSAAGRPVILYLAGRTSAGAAAAASHTAAVAGDHLVARSLARAAGAIVADTLEDFEDLVRLFAMLDGRRCAGPRLGAVTNAGYESVAIADTLGPFELAALAEPTHAALRGILAEARLSEIVAVRNPIDLTPILGDAGYAAVARAVLDDPAVDAAVIGCVPMTGALNTLAPGAAHGDDVAREDSFAARLVALWREGGKPWVAVVDAGPLYDPMARVLEDGGVPTFRTADRAMRLFGVWADWSR